MGSRWRRRLKHVALVLFGEATAWIGWVFVISAVSIILSGGHFLWEGIPNLHIYWRLSLLPVCVLICRNPSQFAQHYSRLRFAPAIASCYNMRDEHFQ
jgi:hypothetical protein